MRLKRKDPINRKQRQGLKSLERVSLELKDQSRLEFGSTLKNIDKISRKRLTNFD